MRPIPEGYEAELKFTVTDEMCAILDGKLIHRVYSTFWMIHHMELAARNVILPFLDKDEEAVGSAVSVNHIAPTPVGMGVTVRAALKEWQGSTVTCNVVTINELGKIGDGTQTQTIIPIEKLKKKIDELYRRKI